MEAGRQTSKVSTELGDLRPGKYYVSAGPSSRLVGHVGDGAQGNDIGYPRVFYPNASELEGAAIVEVNPGRRARLELSLSTVPLYRISGAVVGGMPGQPCHPRLVDSSGQDTGDSCVDEPGDGVVSEPGGAGGILHTRGELL